MGCLSVLVKGFEISLKRQYTNDGGGPVNFKVLVKTVVLNVEWGAEGVF